MRLARLAAWVAAWAALGTAGLARAAEEVAGKPVPGGLHTQRPVTEVGHDFLWMDNFLLYIITAITLFVLVLLAIVIVRFNRKANPEPQTFTHNPTLEVIWTAVPVVILFVIAIPSLQLLDKQLTVPDPDVTIKTTGYQWYWEYEYVDHDFSFASFMLNEDELDEFGYESDEWKLATDTRVVVPVGANVHLLATAADVIHSWTIPSFGVKIDAIPGRMNDTWFNVEEPGTYFGQCSELCGVNHAYMPIVVEVVSQEDYDAWVAEQTAAAEGTTEVAAAD